MNEEREEGGPTPKTTLFGDHSCQSKAKSPEQQERADSPGPSCVSMKSDWSMDQHPESKDGNPQPSKKRKVEEEIADAPGPSCVSMKSDSAMSSPPEFKDGHPSREERPHPESSKVTSAQSVQQHQADRIKRAEENAHAFLDKELKKLSRDLFLHYPQCSESQREEEVDGENEEKRRRAIEGVLDITKLCLMEMNQEELANTLSGMASANTSWSEENFHSCSICLDVFTSPVTTPCGHNFCRTCITTCWDDQVQFKCPVCNKLFHTRPDLQDNTLLSEKVDQFRRSVQVKEQPCVEPREVLCDICTGTQLKAVKSCLVCFISYCQTHLEPHERVAVLKRHQLVEPMDRLEDRMCKNHNQLLELFCQTEQVCVCQLCTIMDHKSHPVVPLKEEYEVKMAQLGKIESEVQQTIQERQRKIQEIKDRVECCKVDADSEIAPGVQVLNGLNACIVDGLDELNQMVENNLKSTEVQTLGLIKELEQEIEDRRSGVKQLSHIEDPLHFLQALRSLKNPPDTRDWTTVEVHSPSMIMSYTHSLTMLKTKLNSMMRKIPDLESVLLTYACRLTLDRNTANTGLTLSEYNRKATMDAMEQSYPHRPERFDYHPQVLCREGLTGRCYWEVEREGEVEIGVAYSGIPRKGNEGSLARHDQAWCLYCRDDRYTACYNNSKRRIYLSPAGCKKVGVYLDQPAGTLSFYRVSPDEEESSDTLTHIHTFQATFTQKLYPGFRICRLGSSVSLCRL